MKRSGLILSYYIEIFPQGLRKTMKTFGLSSAGLLYLLCGASNIGKIWFACGQHEIQ
jgi:hypothetical protein